MLFQFRSITNIEDYQRIVNHYSNSIRSEIPTPTHGETVQYLTLCKLVQSLQLLHLDAILCYTAADVCRTITKSVGNHPGPGLSLSSSSQ